MIRRAITEEADILTKISFESKSFWGYPKEYFDIWEYELTVSPDYIRKNDVFIFAKKNEIFGYYSIVKLEDDIEVSGVKIHKGFWLDHMFIVPQQLRKGIGSKMFDHLLKRCRTKEMSELGILADPNSTGFYNKMGCEYIKDFPSTIKNRSTPYMLIRI